MNVTFVHVTDQARGGGVIAMLCLQSWLRSAGVTSTILCERKTLSTEDSVKIRRSRWSRAIEFGLLRVTSRLGLNDIHNVSSFEIKQHPAFVHADIVHLQGIHGGFFSYLAIPSLAREKPVVFTLHDMWALTGHCAYSYDCERWKSGCGKCPNLDTQPSVRRDGTRLDWRLKTRVYERANLTYITSSHWLTELARQRLPEGSSIHRIPYGVDTNVFSPLDPAACRHVLRIPQDKKVLAFVALTMHALDSDGYRKGGDLLLQALAMMPESLKAKTVLLLLGHGSEEIARQAGVEAVHLGYVESDRIKALAYSAADVFVSPTRAEAFGIVFLESMACGTPSVAFDVGGVSDPVRPGITGYLAEPESVSDLCNGIVKVLEDDTLRAHMSQQCREIAVREYSAELHTQRHVDLYRTLLEERKRGNR